MPDAFIPGFFAGRTGKTVEKTDDTEYFIRLSHPKPGKAARTDFKEPKRKVEEMKKRSDFTLVELALVIVCFVVLAIAFNGCALQRARESAHQTNCRGNLNQIGKALRMYACDYDGRFPNGPARISDDEAIPERDFYGKDRCGGFELLRINGYLCDYAVYVCPSTKVAMGRGTDSLSWSNEGSGSGKANLSYAYQAGLTEGCSYTTGMPGSAISADLTGDAGVDSNKGKSNHQKFGNILYLDGHVKGVIGLGWFSPKNAGYPDLAVGETVVTPNTLRNPVTGATR